MARLHQVGDFFRSIVAAWTPASTESKFIEEGKLNPQEFIEAGDELVCKFPSWQWSRAHPKHSVSWLPPDKQFLVTRNVPCRSRVRDLDYTLTHNSTSADGWYLPGMSEGDCQEIDIRELPQSVPKQNSKKSVSNNVEEEDDNELLGFEDLNDMLEEDAENKNIKVSSNSSIRTYDLSITYDKFYQTPRLWLIGYIKGRNLTSDEIFEDILCEYISKTVTVDMHTGLGITAASIHPCKHSSVMKKVVNGWIKKGIEPRTHLALVVFLKFISSVIPTIDYDCTIDIDTELG